MKAYKLLPLGGVLLAGSMFASQSAFAATCQEIGVGAGQGGTLGLLIEAGSCQDQDKLYTYIDRSGTPDIAQVLLEISTVVLPTEDLHIFALRAPAPEPYPFAGTYTLTYSMTITRDDWYFYQAAMDTDVPGSTPNTDVTKEIYSDAALTDLVLTLNSPSGNPDGPYAFPAPPDQLTTIYIKETFVVGGANSTPAGLLLSATNTYTQRVHQNPEPSILSLFGLGLAGLGYRARARKA